MQRHGTLTFTMLLALLSAFAPMSTDIYVPSLPSIARAFGASTAQVQLTLSSYLVGYALGQVVYGPISDRFGRKPVLLMALALFCAASLVCAVAPGIDVLIAARCLQALGAAGVVLLPRAIVRDLHAGDEAGRELSRIGAIMSFVPVIAPLVGGAVQVAYGWRASFAVIVGVGIAAAGAVWRSLPETLERDAGITARFGESVGHCRALLGNRIFLAHAGILGCSYAGLFAWISGSPFVLQNLAGLSPFAFSVAYAVACIGAFAGGGIAASLATRIGLDRTMGLGAACLATGGLTMAAAVALGLPPVAALVVPMMLYHAGNMLVMPQAIAGALTPFPHCAGTASSILGLAQQLSAALAGTVVGFTLGRSEWPLALAIATMGCASALLWIVSRGARELRPGDPPAARRTTPPRPAPC